MGSMRRSIGDAITRTFSRQDKKEQDKTMSVHVNVAETRREQDMIEQRKADAGPPSQADIEQIVTALQASLPCSGMNRAEVHSLAQLMYEVKFQPKGVICKEGGSGSYYFLVKKGHMEVSTVAKGTINKLGPGDSFGEIALLQSCPRTASVIALDKVVLWAVHCGEFRRALQGCTTRRVNEIRKSVDTVKIFEGLTEDQKMSLANAFIVQVYPPGQEIFRQGDQGKALYMLKHGELSVTIDGVEKRRLQAGAYFGERALLYDEERSATVTAVTACECALITRDFLEDVIGDSLEKQLYQNIICYTLKESKVLGKLTPEQHKTLARGSTIKELQEDQILEPKDLKGTRCFVVLEGTVKIAPV